MAEVLASPVPGEGRVGSEEIVVVDLEAALGDVALEVGSVTPSDTQPATHTRSWFSRVFCGSENPLINVLKLLLLAMWATLGACSYIFQTGILAGISAGGFAFTLYFMVMPAVLQYLKEEMEASMTKKKNLIKKDRKSEILRFDKACPSLTVDDTTHPEDACSVCLADMALGERVRKLPCEHVFHTACLDVKNKEVKSEIKQEIIDVRQALVAPPNSQASTCQQAFANIKKKKVSFASSDSELWQELCTKPRR
mmetsp:Transcript_74803/g.155968  ORF Transcript_74803/g.155968 Transcript_74803/m.155968 type:complete len:253 (+) Transcript_74803:132-890(+)